jgi:hypothetical protein
VPGRNLAAELLKIGEGFCVTPEAPPTLLHQASRSWRQGPLNSARSDHHFGQKLESTTVNELIMQAILDYPLWSGRKEFMPSADQVKALISSLSEGDEAHFYSIAMQIAAHEARLGHGKLAEEIRALIDKAKSRVNFPTKAPMPIARPRGEVAELLSVSYPSAHVKDMILGPQTKKKLLRGAILPARRTHELFGARVSFGA